jgi:lipopolysaccharide transport system permease protein
VLITALEIIIGMEHFPISPNLPVTVIRPTRGWHPFDLRELWEYRDLLYFLVWRDVKVRYTQTVLGVTWAVLQPLLTTVIFSVIFGQLAHLPSNGIPYVVFSFAALLPWQLFSGGLTRASLSLVSDANLLTKVYFPRLVIPMAAVSAGLVDFVVALVVMAGLMVVYGIAPTWRLIWLPAFIVLAWVVTLAVGLWVSALNVQYRDVQHAIPFLVQAWMYASPVAYSTSLIPVGPSQWLYGLNPIAGVIQGFRWVLIGDSLPIGMMLMSIGITGVCLVSGLFYFRRMEESFADVV